MRRDTLIDFFKDLIQAKGTFLAFDDGYRRREYTYEDAGRAARGFAAKLVDAGFSKGDKVVFWGENRPEWVVCYWGCLLAGVVVVPIDYRSSADFVAKVSNLVNARALLVGDDVETGFDFQSGNQTGFHFLWRFADLDWGGDGPMPVVSISRDDVIQIIFTSGATAEPKGVVIRHRNVLANIVPVEREVLKYRKYARPFHPLRFLNLLPLSHMFGQSMASNIPPMVNGTVIFTRSFNPHDVLSLIHRRRISVLVCVQTPLLMLIGGGPMLRHTVQQGMGWRADCLGDMGGFSQSWCHMRNAYPTELPEANALDVWKTAPVAWETCWDLRTWVKNGWSLRYIFNYALALHGSYINNKSAPLPPGQDVRGELQRFLQRLGYRLVLTEFRHPAQVRSGGVLDVAMKWQNVGSAPCYRPYRVAYRIANDRGVSESIVSEIRVDRWLPGSIELFTDEFLRQPADLPPGDIVQVTDQIQLPAHLQPGHYRVSLAIVDEASRQPVVQLGIEGRADDGWYPLSTLDVTP